MIRFTCQVFLHSNIQFMASSNSRVGSILSPALHKRKQKDLGSWGCSLCVSCLPHSQMLQNYSASLQIPDCAFVMTYQESLQQVRDKNHAQQQVQHFFILNAACENTPGAHLEWRYFMDGQLAKHQLGSDLAFPGGSFTACV